MPRNTDAPLAPAELALCNRVGAKALQDDTAMSLSAITRALTALPVRRGTRLALVAAAQRLANPAANAA